MSWVEEHAGRLEFELKALADLEIVVRQNDEAMSRGAVELILSLPPTLVEAGVSEITAKFPSEYPYFPPKVFARGLNADHHVNPFSGEICLLANPTTDWSTGQTLASLLDSQLIDALKAATSEAEDDREARQAEPFSAYYTYTGGVTVLVDGAWKIPADLDSGEIRVQLGAALASEGGGKGVLMGLTKVIDNLGVVLATLPTELQERLTGPIVTGRWTRLDKPPRSDSALELWKIAEESDSAQTQANKVHDRDIEFRAIVFPQETRLREVTDGWLFLLKVRGRRRPSNSGSPAKRAAAGEAAQHLHFRAGFAGREDLAARIPSLRELGEKRVLLVGAGAIGSALAIHLARAGVGHLTIVDHDVVEPGNLVRHATTLRAVGVPKAIAVGMLAREVSPYITVEYSISHIGALPDPANDEATSALSDLHDYDLVVDGSADLAVQRLLSSKARAAGVAYQFLEATNGGWGGSTAIIPPDSAWCYFCYAWYLHEDPSIIPAGSPAPLTQPIGCAQPTFTGAAFDLEEVTLQAARMAVEFLTSQPSEGHSAHLATLTLRDESGRRTLPVWQERELIRHEKCQAPH